MLCALWAVHKYVLIDSVNSPHRKINKHVLFQLSFFLTVSVFSAGIYKHVR